jgi:hypothetical protein
MRDIKGSAINTVHLFFSTVKDIVINFFDGLYKSITNSVNNLFGKDNIIATETNKYVTEGYIELKHDVEEMIEIAEEATDKEINVILTYDTIDSTKYKAEVVGLVS